MKLSTFLVLSIWLSTSFAMCAENLTVVSKTIQPREMGPLTYLEIQYGSETFSLVPPPHLRIQTDAQTATIQFLARTGTFAMSIQFTTNDARNVLASTDTLRQYAAPHWPQAQVLEEFPVFSGSSAGKGMDLGFVLHGSPTRCRAAAIPLSHGCLNIVFTCSANEFPAAQRIFGSLLTSFQRIEKPKTSS